MEQPTGLPLQAGNRASRSQKVFQRAYMACVAYRRTKSKCETSEDLNTCVKCKREKRPCEFRGRRTAKETAPSSLRTVRPRRDPGVENPKTGQCHSGSSGTLDRLSRLAAQRAVPISPRSDAADEASRSRRAAESISSATHHLSSQSPVEARPDRTYLHNSPENPPSLPAAGAARRSDLEIELMQTVVSSSQDALNLLFKAASQQDAEPPPDRQDEDQDQSGPQLGQFGDAGPSPYSSISLTSPSQELLGVWKQSYFVRHGWITPREGIAYIDLFFANISHLSLVTNIHFSRHENHRSLVLEEPLLCSTLLMISSRYNQLPGSGGATRSHYIHDCLWRYIQNVIHQLSFGNDTTHHGSRPRTLGCVEALLLLTEWHPRALAFPQFSDNSVGGDAALVLDGGEDSPRDPDFTEASEARWREELFEPAKRVDRMSWMMLGLATTLAHELGVYDEYETEASKKDDSAARKRLKRLLYLNVNQLALTLGCSPFLSQGISNSNLGSDTIVADDAFWEGEKLITMWIDLTGLLKMVKSLSFSSRSTLRPGAHDVLVNQFQPLLSHWFERFQSFKPQTASQSAVDLLFVDYQYVRMYVGSIGIQAVVESINSGSNSGLSVFEVLRIGNRAEFTLTKEVLDASMLILSKAVSLARSGVLRFCPRRVFFRITSACVFLLKALGLGALSVERDQCTNALTSLASGDAGQPWGKYAVLIQRYATQFRLKAGPSAVHLPGGDAPSTGGYGQSIPVEGDVRPENGPEQLQGLDYAHFFDSVQDSSLDNWLMEPWDSWVFSTELPPDDSSTMAFSASQGARIADAGL